MEVTLSWVDDHKEKMYEELHRRVHSWEKGQGLMSNLGQTISTELRERCSVQVCVVCHECTPAITAHQVHEEDAQEAPQIHSFYTCPLKHVTDRKFFLLLAVS